jgi:hypothetical protein
MYVIGIVQETFGGNSSRPPQMIATGVISKSRTVIESCGWIFDVPNW